MNAKLHIMQAIDWDKYDLTEWLRQFGYWQGAMVRIGGSSENPLVGAIKRAKLRLKKRDREKIIAHYFCDESFSERGSKKSNTCLITDDEARAVQRLIIDVLDGCDSEAMFEWMDAIVDRYFNQKSWTELVNRNRTAMDAKYDVKCGLAALHSRYQFIKYKKGSV
ncbi:hypothetical protein [Acinetobacter haemolyticus]|uniref:hypothetical protein n=1 Tax=Acinetobacter haemolyticus TaxID=29430 RepID=UPI003AF483D2